MPLVNRHSVLCLVRVKDTIKAIATGDGTQKLSHGSKRLISASQLTTEATATNCPLYLEPSFPLMHIEYRPQNDDS